MGRNIVETIVGGLVLVVAIGFLVQLLRVAEVSTSQDGYQLEVRFYRAGGLQSGADVRISGVIFTRAPTFPTSDVSLAAGDQSITGVLFTRAGTFPTGAINAQPLTIIGVLFTATVIFPTGIMRLAALTFWIDDKVVQTRSSLGGDSKVAYTKLEPSAPNPL